MGRVDFIDHFQTPRSLFSIKKMISKQIFLTEEFKKFIIVSKTGRRLMSSGKKIRLSTIEQYEMTLRLLLDFEQHLCSRLRILVLYKSPQRIINGEKRYWKKFFIAFKKYLYENRNCYDNYVANTFKTIKSFFNYLAKERCLPIGTFHQQFKVANHPISPIVLSPSQLKFLISDRDFEKSLPENLQRTKDIFVFGCTVGLRYQDLMQLKKENIILTENGHQIQLHTQKTNTFVKIPLPNHAVSIYLKYKKQTGKYVLPRLSNTNLNIQIKAIGQRAGWMEPLPKIQFKMGEPVEKKTSAKASFKFYEHITSHTMRRTAITTL